MKVTMLVGYFTPEESADTHLNRDLAEDLARMGATVTVITPFPSRGIDEGTQKYYEALREEKISENLRILRVGKREPFRKGLFLRGWSFIKKAWKIYQIARGVETDIFFVVSTPPFLGYVAALLSRRVPTVYKLQDIFPDSLVHAGKVGQRNPAVSFLHILERWVYQRVTAIFACSDDIKKTIMQRGVSEKKIRVIYDWIDERNCIPISRNENKLFDKFLLQRDGFYVSYAGNIGHLQNVETILKAAQRLQSEAPKIQFIIIGDGAWRAELLQQIAARNLNNVRWFAMQPVADVSYVYSLGDIELVSLKPDVTQMALPSKTWSIMSAARPVICEIDLYSQLCNIIREQNCGTCVAPGDDAALAAQIVQIYGMGEIERAEMGQRGRIYVEHFLSRDQATKCYFNEISTVLECE